MRDSHIRDLALECLQLADPREHAPEDVVARAAIYLAFVTGEDTDDAKAKLDAVRKITS